MKKLKVVTILGTRPEIIRLSQLIIRLDEYTNHVLVHTGQNFDPKLSDVFFDDLDLRQPDVFLRAEAGSLGSSLASMFLETEKILLKEAPDAVMILGDTNSALMGVLARRLDIPVFHMEAGNRSFDERVPEELNRRVVDHVSSFNLPYSRFARENLLREGLHPNNICLTGSPMPEVLEAVLPKVHQSQVLSSLNLQPKKYFVVSAHRQETVDNEGHLSRLLDSIGELSQEFEFPVVVSAHPRIRSTMKKFGLSEPSGVMFLEPFGYIDYLKLQLEAHCVLSDSGTISEESAYLGFPAITIRNSFERQEAMETGSMILAGLNFSIWRESIAAATNLPSLEKPEEYLSQDFSSRVYKFLISKVSASGG